MYIVYCIFISIYIYYIIIFTIPIPLLIDLILTISSLLVLLTSDRGLALKAGSHPVDRLADVNELDEWLAFLLATLIPKVHEANSLQKCSGWRLVKTHDL